MASQSGKGIAVPEVAAFALLTALGGALVVTSFGYGLRTDRGWVGPGFMPMVLGSLMFLMAGWQLVRVLTGRQAEHHDRLADLAGAEPEPRSQEDEDALADVDIFGRTAKQRVRQMWTVVAAIAAAILIVPLLGLPISFGLMVFFISTFVERRKLLPAALITVVSIGVVHLLFVTFLGVPLPTGAIGLGI